MSTKRGFLLEWETNVKAKFKTKLEKPFDFKERYRLANVMTYEEIQNTLEYDEDQEKKRIRRWKELHYFSNLMKQPEHCHGVVENALWRFGNVTLQQFLMSMTHEYKFTSVVVHDHLKMLYYTFSGGLDGNLDWKDITASLLILKFFRLVRDSPVELLLIIFDVYANPINITNEMRQTKSFDSIMDCNYINDYSIISKILLLPTRLDNEMKVLSDMLEQAIYDYFKITVFDKIPNITKGIFRTFLSSNSCEKLIIYWTNLCWNLLTPSDRMTVLDESQLEAIHKADIITSKYKWRTAVVHYDAILIK